ncbi:hypothetical protein F4678DRAFT_412942 [Xylaria arbuscula]|nr:hypothetical protein F4678DRAFT_412942 [Xylaria arbuscula]
MLWTTLWAGSFTMLILNLGGTTVTSADTEPFHPLPPRTRYLGGEYIQPTAIRIREPRRAVGVSESPKRPKEK